ncbi:MAG TPA: tRNA-dihydrouridine synthase, partial [Xanthomonadales bacterium]|nr:tRNA-dihydrouridine synthase [Xanthomonadales bacterium]
ARMAQNAGIKALAVHGRTRADRFKGEAEYDTIRDVCRAVDLPVFANGDIKSPEQAAEVLRYTGADGVMVGRAAQGNPWIFREIRHFLETGKMLAPPESWEVRETLYRHLRQLHRAYGEAVGVRVARKHIGWYLAGRPEAERFHTALMRCEFAREQFELLDNCFEATRQAA